MTLNRDRTPIDEAAALLNTRHRTDDMHARRQEAILAGRSLLNVEQVSKVLNLHASFKASPGIQESMSDWWWECDGCSTKVAEHVTARVDVIAGLAKHQAEAIRAAQLGEHA